MFSQIGISQNLPTTSNENSTPAWVEMMKDQTVKFYDVQKEANNYFFHQHKYLTLKSQNHH